MMRAGVLTATVIGSEPMPVGTGRVINRGVGPRTTMAGGISTQISVGIWLPQTQWCRRRGFLCVSGGGYVG